MSSALASILKPGIAAGSSAVKKVVIGDGAEWIWNIADDHFPGGYSDC